MRARTSRFAGEHGSMDEFEAGAVPQGLTDLTGMIVVAYVAHNAVPISELPHLIVATHAALSNLGRPVGGIQTSRSIKLTAAQVRRSITPEGLVSFIDGRSYKTIKRHLMGHGLSPADYRAKYGLPADYPMTCASYSERRSALAKRAGPGQHRRHGEGA